MSVMVVGASYESLNTAIWLASLGRAVRVCADGDAVGGILANYKFDRQITALWQMYLTTGQITLTQAIENCTYLWVFLGESGVSGTDVAWQDIDSNTQIILSGSLAIGEMAQLAHGLTQDAVCYVPFVFIKDGMGFLSLSAPDLLLVGEKRVGVTQGNELIASLSAHAGKRYVSDIKTIEFARSTIMAMLATRLSFINEVARLADKAGVDIAKVQTILGLDKRIGGDYLSAGWGFGGYTLPSETALLGELFIKEQVDAKLLKATCAINEDQKELIFRKFWRYFDGFIEDKVVMIWGAGYRAGTGRTTGGAIHPLLKLLWSYNIKTYVYAPNAGFELKQMYGDEPLFVLSDESYALEGLDALFVLNWLSTVKIDVDGINRHALPIFDGKNVFNDDEIAHLTGHYEGIGRHVC